MDDEFGFDESPPPLESRLGAIELAPPFNPAAYFFVGFFLGFVPMGYLAVTNATRLSQGPELRTKTLGAAVAIAVIGFAIIALSPATWVADNSDARLLIQIIGAVGSVGLHQLHRGPALSRAIGNRDYTSAWKRIVPLVLIALLQAAVAFLIVSARGLR